MRVTPKKRNNIVDEERMIKIHRRPQVRSVKETKEAKPTAQQKTKNS